MNSFWWLCSKLKLTFTAALKKIREARLWRHRLKKTLPLLMSVDKWLHKSETPIAHSKTGIKKKSILQALVTLKWDRTFKSFVIKHLEIHHSHFFSSIFLLEHLPNNLFHKTCVSHSMPMCSQRRTLSLSCAWLFAAPQTVARQVPLPMGFPRKEYRSGLPFPPPGAFPESLVYPALQADTLPLHHPGGLYIWVFSNASLLHTHFFHRYQTLLIDSGV